MPETGWRIKNKGKKQKLNVNILLAGSQYKLENGDKIDWHKIYKDKEDIMSLSRFDWLLRLMVDQPSNNLPDLGLQWICDWIQINQEEKKGIIWESYSVSERIVNWLLFFCASKNSLSLDSLTINIIGTALEEHISHLVFNLEYRGKKTNNHIINNARALYIGGRLLNISYAEDIGRSIIKNETDSLLPDGVLNEGSIHYQFLVTRSYLEIYWVACETNDIKLIVWLKKRIKKMISVCNHFLLKVNGSLEIPFIGDISPDYPPDWFYGYPFNGLEDNDRQNLSQWSRLWGNFDKFEKWISNIEKPVRDDHVGYLKKNQWIIF